MNRAERFFMRAPIGLYSVGLGGLLGKRFLLLEHTGRTSGFPRKTVLEVVEWGADGVPIVASGWGEGSDWCRNAMADPDVAYVVGRRRVDAEAVRIEGGDARDVFDRYRRDHPKAAAMIGERIGVSLVDDVDAAADRLPLFRLVPR